MTYLGAGAVFADADAKCERAQASYVRVQPIKGRQGAPVHPRTLAALIHQGWVTEPLPTLPLFGAPARDGSITAAGRAALTRRNSKW